MNKIVPLFVLTTLLLTSIGIGGVKPVRKAIMDEPGVPNPAQVQEKGDPGLQYGGLTWSLVDTMNNCYGMLSNRVDPLAYDPVSGYVGMVHRAKTSYGSSSGELWYNTSPDGISWTRISALNAGVATVSRYPSATIASGAGPGSELFSFSAPQLNPSAFGYVIYGVDLLNSGAPWAREDQGGNTYWSNTRIVAADDAPYVWWAVSHDPGFPNAENAAVHLWRTDDYGTVSQLGLWDISLFQTRGLEIGLCYRNGALYAGGFGTFIGDPNEVYNIFYSKSTDNGSTWTDPDGPFLGIGDWRSIPILASSPYDDWDERMSFEMFADNDGFLHILGVLVDLDDPNADMAVVDIFKTVSGWDARFVAENLARNTLLRYGPIDETGFHVGSAVSPDGMAMAAVWLSAQDSAGRYPDIWVSTRHATGDSWSTPVNLTTTPDYAELLLQVAPTLRSDGGNEYTMFLARAYQQGITTYPPDDLSPADIFAAAVPLTIAPGGGGTIPCEEIDVFKAKCDSAGTAWGLVRLIHSTQYAGETVEFQLDGDVYPVELITNGTLTIGRLEVPQAGYGQHALSLVTPGGCFDPIPFNCQADGSGDDPEFDAIWAEFESGDDGKPTTEVVPDRVSLIGNYPNPFNPVTTINYELPAEMHVTLGITDITGREVTRLVDGLQTAGRKSITFDGRSLSSGIYFYRLQAGSFVETKRMVLLR